MPGRRCVHTAASTTSTSPALVSREVAPERVAEERIGFEGDDARTLEREALEVEHADADVRAAIENPPGWSASVMKSFRPPHQDDLIDLRRCHLRVEHVEVPAVGGGDGGHGFRVPASTAARKRPMRRHQFFKCAFDCGSCHVSVD